MTLSSPFTSSFSLGSHSTLNGDLSMPGSYVSLHLSPQVSNSVVYGRSPLVSPQGTDRQDGPQSPGVEMGAGGETRVSRETGWSSMVERSPGTHKALGAIPSTWEVKAGGLGVQSQPIPHKPLF